jgi:hypothetical protein
MITCDAGDGILRCAPYCCFCIHFDFDSDDSKDGFCKCHKERREPMDCCEDDFHCVRIPIKDEDAKE